LANPYTAIGERNIFGLKDPPLPEPPTPEKEPEPPPNVKVTGIVTLNGIARALVRVTSPAKPPKPVQDKTYILVPGEERDGIRVLQIDEEHGPKKEIQVKLRYASKESWLALEKDTPRAAPPPAPGKTPAQVTTAQAAAQKLAAARAAAAGGRTQPVNPTAGLVRPVRTGTPGVPAASGGLQSAGQRNRFFQAKDQVGDLTREEQIILIEANRLNTLEDQAAGLVPPPPPTELTPPELDPTTPPEPDLQDQISPGF
jgi:hypothetical protein